jgi:alkylation response protein AidB-like acyl-CoA dehydrogenase
LQPINHAFNLDYKFNLVNLSFVSVDSAQIDRDATIPKEVLDGLKELGLFGLQIPEEYCKIYSFHLLS